MKQKTLLLIDDDNDFSSLVKFILEHNTKWQVLTALDGTNGVAKAQSQKPSLILLDVVMPNLNGVDVYHLLKSNPSTSSIPVVFVTAMVKMEKVIKSQIAEDIEIMTKPLNVMRLGIELKSFLKDIQEDYEPRDNE